VKKQTEFERFNETMKALIAVPHSEIKAKLEAEKLRKRKPAKPSASDREGVEKD
jgi:hypothetical protein